MMDVYATALGGLTRIKGVQGAMIVDLEAGVPVASELAEGIGATALAALTGSLFRRTGDASLAAGRGDLHALQLDAERGHLVLVGAGSLVVAVLAARSAQLGLVRVQAARCAKELDHEA